MIHYTDAGATSEWLRAAADDEHDAGETLYATPPRDLVFDVDLDDELRPLRCA